MLSFTTDFKTAALADTRDPRALVKVYWGDSLSDTSVVITSNDFNSVDRSGQVTNGETESGELWAYLGPEIIADGTFKVMPSVDTGSQVGWFGQTFGDGSGNFGTPPWLQVAHDARPYDSVLVAGDSEYDEYPVDFDVSLVHDSGTEVINVTGNSDRIWAYDLSSTLTGVTSIKVEVSKWSAVSTVVKITQISGSFIETYNSDDIVSLDILEEANSDTGGVPIGSVTSNEIDLTLLNTDRRFSHGNTDSDYSEVLVSGRKIEVWLGFVLPSGTADVTGDVTGYIVLTEGSDKVGYMPYGVYWSKDWISSDESQETQVVAHDITHRLRQLEFLRSEVYVTETVEDIVDSVLNDALNYLPDLEWSVSADVASEVISIGYFDKKSYLEVLKDIAEASLSYSYVDRTGVLIVGSQLNKVTPVSAEQQITEDEYFNYVSNPKIDELVNRVRVGYTTYTLASVAEDIYTDETVLEIPAGETELILYLTWEKYPVDTASVVLTVSPVSVAGTLTADYDIYAIGADITITGTAGDTFTISATGKPYTLEEITDVLASDSDSIARYGQREFALTGNPLIAAETAGVVANNVLSGYGGLRGDGEVSWPGSTLVSVGDTVEVTEFKSDSLDITDFFVIKRQQISYDGAIDSEMSVRRG